MQAKSTKGKSTEEIKGELEKSLTDGFKPTLAVCFISKNPDSKHESHSTTNSWLALKEKK